MAANVRVTPAEPIICSHLLTYTYTLFSDLRLWSWTGRAVKGVTNQYRCVYVLTRQWAVTRSFALLRGAHELLVSPMSETTRHPKHDFRQLLSFYVSFLSKTLLRGNSIR